MSYNPYSLIGKNILVTGASSGIGRATAVECSKLGATMIVTGRNEERLRETFQMLEGEGHLLIVADLTKEEDVDNLVTETPVLNGLVNNAGIGKTLPVQFYNMEDIQHIYGTNFISPVLLTKALLKKKKISKGASIVFTSSISPYVHEFGHGIYGCTKAGIETYSKFAAKELATKSIRCNSVHPGMVETPLIHRGTITEEQLEEDKKHYPLKRYGKPEDVAWGIIYLLSDASSWMTGHSLVIDGGRTLK